MKTQVSGQFRETRGRRAEAGETGEVPDAMTTEANIALGLITWGVLALMVTLICVTWMEGAAKRARRRGEREHKAGIRTPDSMEDVDGVHMSMGAGTALLLLMSAAVPFLAPMSLLFAWFAPLWARIVTGVVTFVAIMMSTSNLVSETVRTFKPDGSGKTGQEGEAGKALVTATDSEPASKGRGMAAAGRSGGRSLGKASAGDGLEASVGGEGSVRESLADGTTLAGKGLAKALGLGGKEPDVMETGEIELSLTVSPEPPVPGSGVTATVSAPTFPNGYEAPRRERRGKWDARTIVPMIAKAPEAGGCVAMDGDGKAALSVSFADSSGTDGAECYAVVFPTGDGSSMIGAFTKEGDGDGTELVSCPVEEAVVVVDSECGSPTATPFHRLGRMTGMRLVVPAIETVRKAGLVVAMLDHPDEAMNAMGQRICQVLGVPTKDGDVLVMHEGKGLAVITDEGNERKDGSDSGR